MLFAIISAIICFIFSIVLFTKNFRKIKALNPLAIYLIFQGIWQLASFIVLDMYPSNKIILYVNYIGTALLLIYYIFYLLINRGRAGKRRRQAPAPRGYYNQQEHQDNNYNENQEQQEEYYSDY